MIGKDQIAEAIRYADAEVEEHYEGGGTLPSYWRKRDVDEEGLRYVAEQRALRMVMLDRGQNPNLTQLTPISLSQDERARLLKYAAAWLDGFAAAFALRTED